MIREISGAELGTQVVVDMGHQGKTLAPHLFDIAKSHPGAFKPHGLWTSSHGDPDSWTEWCRSEMPHWIDGRRQWRLTPEPDARLVLIETLDDLIAVREVAPPADQGYGSLVNEFGADWEVFRDEYDGIHLTGEGQWATRMTEPSLYGWDCESTVWFRWAFTHVSKGGVWHYPDRHYEDSPLWTYYSLGESEARRDARRHR